jgi:hypothetical protein
MDERTLEALKGSIEKWEAIVAGTGEDRGWRNCPLCLIFNNPEIDPDGLIQCAGCPVNESTGHTGCEGTPYDRYHYERTQEAACAELDFLRSLLPAEAVSAV